MCLCCQHTEIRRALLIHCIIIAADSHPQLESTLCPYNNVKISPFQFCISRSYAQDIVPAVSVFSLFCETPFRLFTCIKMVSRFARQSRRPLLLLTIRWTSSLCMPECTAVVKGIRGQRARRGHLPIILFAAVRRLFSLDWLCMREWAKEEILTAQVHKIVQSSRVAVSWSRSYKNSSCVYSRKFRTLSRFVLKGTKRQIKLVYSETLL